MSTKKNLSDVQFLAGSLQGGALSAVCFLNGYLQLHFDGPYLNIYTPPKIILPSCAIRWGSQGFRDVLCELLGEKFLSANEDKGKVLTLVFTGAALEIPLDDSSRVCAEAAMFQDGTGKGWVVW